MQLSACCNYQYDVVISMFWLPVWCDNLYVVIIKFVFRGSMVGCVPQNVVAIVWTENVIISMAPACKDVIPVGRGTSAPNQVQLYNDKDQKIKVFNSWSFRKKNTDKKLKKEFNVKQFLTWTKMSIKWTYLHIITSF